MDAKVNASHSTWGLPCVESIASQLASLATGSTATGLVDSFAPPMRPLVSVRPIVYGDEPLLKSFMLDLQQRADMKEMLREVQHAMHRQRDLFAVVALSHAPGGEGTVVGLAAWCAAQRVTHSTTGPGASTAGLAQAHAMVEPTHRRCGIGKRLIQMLVLGAAVRRIGSLTLHLPDATPSGPHIAHSLARAGWTPTAPSDGMDGTTLKRDVPSLAECLRHLQRPRKRERMRLAGDLPRGWDHARTDA